MAYLRDRVVILRTEPFRDDDLWVTCYGQVLGKMTSVARGARRLHAKQAGHVQPLVEADVMIAKGAAFDKLAVARVTHPHLALRKSLAALSIAGAFADLVDRLTKPEVSDPGIFFLLQETLELASYLEQDPSPWRGRLLFAASSLKLLDELGYAPPLDEKPPSLSEPSFKLLRFLRSHPLPDVLRITASSELFSETSSAVAGFLREAPLEQEPHGGATIVALLERLDRSWAF